MEAVIEKINESYLIKFIVDNHCVDVYAVDKIKLKKEVNYDKELSFCSHFKGRNDNGMLGNIVSVME